MRRLNRILRSIETSSTQGLRQTGAIPRGRTLTGELKKIKVGDYLTRKNVAPIWLNKEDTVLEAIKKMNDKKVGSVLICNKDRELTGIFTERDYLYKLVLEGRSSNNTALQDVMTADVMVGKPSYNLDLCCSLMAKTARRHLPICDIQGNTLTPNQKVIGVVTAKDMVNEVAKITESSNIAILEETVANVFDYLGRNSSQECYVHATDTVFTALSVMKKYQIGGLFVTDYQKVVGMFTERDYLTKGIVQGRISKETQVSEVMNKSVVCVKPNSSVGECLSVMFQNNIQTLPIIPIIGTEIDDQEKDEIIGMITSMDVLQFLESEDV